jgi:hypothetical protein
MWSPSSPEKFPVSATLSEGRTKEEDEEKEGCSDNIAIGDDHSFHKRLWNCGRSQPRKMRAELIFRLGGFYAVTVVGIRLNIPT